MSSSIVKRLIVATILMVCTGSGFWWLIQPHPVTDKVNVLTAKIRRGAIIEKVEATGVLEPVRLVQVGAQVTGQLTALHVALGNPVRAGDLIAEIDSLQQQNELRLARAALSEAQATQRSRQFQSERAERALKRQRELYAGEAGSGADLQDADSAVLIARADLDLSVAQIERANVEVEKAETNLRYTKISAPIDGRVVALVAKPGQTLNAAQTTPVVAVIAQTDTMTVRVQVSESDIGRIKVGQSAHFTTFGDRKTKRESVLAEVQPAPSSFLSNQDGTTGQQSSTASAQAIYYNALFRAPNTDGRLLPMMTANVTITVAANNDALIAPLNGLDGPDADGRYSAIIKKADGVTEARPVKIGLTNRTDAEIIDGLSEGDEIILRSDSGPTDTDMLLR